MINKIKGAIFDMDGTLVDSLMVWDVLWDEFGRRFTENGKFRPSAEADKAVRTMTLKEAMHYLHELYNIGANGDELLEAANKTIRKFYAEDVKLKEGVIEFLEYCFGKGVKMCIASATDKKLIAVAVEHCGIGKYFSGVLSCADIGKGKEEPDIYLKALEFLGTTKEESCVFEDSAVAICTAHKIGINTVGIYDKLNYGQDVIKDTANVYIAQGESLKKLIK